MNGHRPRYVASRHRRPLQRSGGWLLAAALAIALPAGPACALEIDQIRVLSGAGQPLFAQIPLVVDNPGELQSVQVALASSATFARIGLPRPQGTVASLRFSVDRNPRQPMIIVESSQPVTEAFLTFLIQLQWNGGQMVREFSLSMGASAPAVPAAAAALPEPPSAPVAPPPVATPVAPEAAPPQITLPTDTTVLPEQPQAIPLPAPVPAAADPAAVEAAPAPVASPQPVPVPAPAPPPIPVLDRGGARAPAPTVMPAPTRTPPVARVTPDAPAAVPAAIPLAGDRPRATAPAPAAPASAPSGQARAPARAIGPVAAGDNLTRIAQGMVEPGQSLEQVMVALVRANPQAFANGNINQLQRGAQLRVPGKDEIAQMGQAQAEAAVREQTRLWLDGKAADTPALQPLAAPPAPTEPPAPAVAPIPVVQTNPRLQILPPEAGAATTPGAASATRNEQVASSLLQSQEDIQQLKERLANLEEISRKQQQLIAMQEQQLRQRSGVAGPAVGNGGIGWIIALVGLLLGVLIWWRTRPRALLLHPDRPTWHADGTADDRPRTRTQ